MRIAIRILIWLLVFAGAAALAEEKAKEYKPTEIQSLRLQVKQRDALLAWNRYQAALNDLSAESERVKKANGWPDEVVFNGETLKFSAPSDEVKAVPLPAAPGLPAKKP